MASPFPGMDPYLERHWGDIHIQLIAAACAQLNQKLPGDLYARGQEYVRLETAGNGNGSPGGYYPDVRVIEQAAPSPTAATAATLPAAPLVVSRIPYPVQRSIHIIDAQSGGRVVTAIELLSPANKVGEAGREAYRHKQRDLLAGGVNLVEIDLLREGGYVLAAPEENLPPAYREPYRICVVRANRPATAEVYRVSLRESLPSIRIPLRPVDADVALELQPLLGQAYSNGRYENIDYRVEPAPPLQGEDASWANALLREKGRR
jgi:Protein of unknown function (DUF4058)